MKEKMSKAAVTVCSAGLLCVLVLTAGPLQVEAQKKSTRSKRRPVAKPTPTPTPLNLNAEAAQVAEQIKLISRFLYVYGKVANGLELAEEQQRRGEVSSTVAAQTGQSRDVVVSNISGLRAGMEPLIAQFRANPRLQVQYLKLSYAVEAVTNAERLAANSRFDEAGKSLVTAIERLTEVMLALR